VMQPVFAVIASDDALLQRVAYIVVLTALYAKFWLLVVVEWKRDTYRILYFMQRDAQIAAGELPGAPALPKPYEQFEPWATENLAWAQEILTWAQEHLAGAQKNLASAQNILALVRKTLVWVQKNVALVQKNLSAKGLGKSTDLSHFRLLFIRPIILCLTVFVVARALVLLPFGLNISRSLYVTEALILFVGALYVSLIGSHVVVNRKAVKTIVGDICVTPALIETPINDENRFFWILDISHNIMAFSLSYACNCAIYQRCKQQSFYGEAND
jgi:hypothetical protein